VQAGTEPGRSLETLQHTMTVQAATWIRREFWYVLGTFVGTIAIGTECGDVRRGILC
jgi:hypothetical protein